MRDIIRIVPAWAWVVIGALGLLALAGAVSAALTRRRLAVSQLAAATDKLTGLPNRAALDETMTRAIAYANRTRRPLAVVLFDIDHFKSIDDRFGHLTGDVTLATVARVAREKLRESDTIGRFGGEEFLVLLPDTDHRGAAVTAEHLRSAIADATIEGAEGPITASFGIAVIPSDGRNADQALARADSALYCAKRGGRDRVEHAGAAVALSEARPAVLA